MGVLSWLLLATLLLPPPESNAGFGQDLISRPTYEHAPNLMIQRKGEPPTPAGITSLTFKKSDFQIKLSGTPQEESWSLEVKGTIRNPEGSPETKTEANILLIYDGTEHPVTRSADSSSISFSVPLKDLAPHFELVSVNARGAVERERIVVALDRFPETATESLTPRWMLSGAFNLHFGLEYLVETTSLGSTGNANLRLPRLAGEINLRRAKTPHSPAWRFHLLGHAEYSLPQTAYSTTFAYPIAWSVALKVAREHCFGSATGWSFSPFLQLERTSSVYASGLATTVLTETYNVLAPASFYAIWAILGLKTDHIFFKRNWEFALSAGRSIIGGAWSGSTDLYWLGGWLVRASARADITQRIWAGLTGDFIALLGGGTIIGGGGGLQLGMRF